MIEKNYNAIQNRFNAMLKRAEAKVIIQDGERFMPESYFNRTVKAKLKDLGYSKDEFLAVLNAQELKYKGGSKNVSNNDR